MKYFIYILECINGAYYTGYTTDIRRRYQEHRQGSALCKYTRSFPPKRLAACWEVNAELSFVLKVERAIKSLPRAKKINLTQDPKTLIDSLTAIGFDFIAIAPKIEVSYQNHENERND